MWIGKLIGAFFGFLVGSFPGLLIGLFIGHRLDVGMRARTPLFFAATQEQIKHTQTVFFNITFQVMGHMAKADGRVSESEIRAARQTMHYMQLNSEQIKHAISNFTKGKSPGFDLDSTLNQLIQVCYRNRSLLQTFVEIQFQAARTQQTIDKEKKEILQNICKRLGFAPLFSWEYDHLFHQRHQKTRFRPPSPENALKAAYRLLDVTRETTPTNIKKAYRRLMSQHHPDKLIAKGLPEEMLKMATDKTQKIQQAYDLIRKSRGF